MALESSWLNAGHKLKCLTNKIGDMMMVLHESETIAKVRKIHLLVTMNVV